jgi:PAS domain S-box-containing protein
MLPPDYSKQSPPFRKMQCWIDDGRTLSRKQLWSVLPGIAAILTVAAVFLILHGRSGHLPDPAPLFERSLDAAGFVILGACGIGFLLSATFRTRRLFRAHLRQGELALAQTQSIIATTHDGVIVIDEQNRIQSLNPAGEKLFGQTQAKVIGQNISLLIPDRAALQDRTALPRTVKAAAQREGCRPFFVELTLNEMTLDGRRLLVVLARDATADQRGDEALKHIGLAMAPAPGEEFMRSLLRQLSRALQIERVFVLEMLGEGSSAVAMLTVAQGGELRGTVAIDLRHTVCAEVLGKGFRVLTSSARQQFPEDNLLADHRADAFAGMPLTDHRGKALGVIGVLHEQQLEDAATIESTLRIFAARATMEIERKRSEEALGAEKERLAVTLRSIGDACVTLDNDGRVVLFNPVAERLTGWLHDEAAGRPVNDVLHLVDERTRRRSQHLLQRIVTSGASDTPGTLNVLISRDGDEHTVETSSAPIRDRVGRKLGAIIVLRDVTERQHADDERQKAEKLESLGLVAGGIAHDFNNLLTTILGNVTLALGGSDVPPVISAHLAAARKASQRAQELAGQLLTFAKGGAPIKQPTNLAQLLTDTAHCAVAGSRTACDTQLAADLWAVEVDPGQLAQVIANLTANADQAMPSGGSILVTAENLDLPLDSISLGLHAGRWVRFGIEDHGVGIPEQYLKKIFDPYFTTKPTGSGLGLATAYSIVKNHGGVILVESTPAVGSTFNVYLPASEKELLAAGAEPAAPVPMGGGRVLVLDDEEAICMLVTCALEPLGYEVIETQDGSVALAKYEEAMKEGRNLTS